MNKKEPMTTKEAQAKHQCINYVEDYTCSTRCRSCGNRVWFTGSWNRDTPDDFNCPYCGKPCVSPYKTNDAGLISLVWGE